MPYAVLYPTSDIIANWPYVYPSTPSTHYDKVDDPDASPDEDATYIQTDDTSTPYGDRYGKASLSLPSGAVITSVQIRMRAKRVPLNPSYKANPRIYGALRISGNSYFGNTARTLTNDAYADFTDTWTVNPATGNPWTLDDINNTLEAFNILGNSAYRTDPYGLPWFTLVRATQCLLIVNYTVPAIAKRISGNGLVWVVA